LKKLLQISFSMIKRLVYIVLLLIFAPAILSAKINTARHGLVKGYDLPYFLFSKETARDTTKKHQQEEDKKKIKEISKAKRQSKPEKIDETEDVQVPKVQVKPKRQRRPEGLERPPEIPRRDGN
jgi:predicted Holliday junction resolvase-like endonuclease